MSGVNIYKAKYFDDMIYTHDQDEPEFRFVKLSDYKLLEKSDHYANNVVVPTIEAELKASEAARAELQAELFNVHLKADKEHELNQAKIAELETRCQNQQETIDQLCFVNSQFKNDSTQNKIEALSAKLEKAIEQRDEYIIKTSHNEAFVEAYKKLNDDELSAITIDSIKGGEGE